MSGYRVLTTCWAVTWLRAGRRTAAASAIVLALSGCLDLSTGAESESAGGRQESDAPSLLVQVLTRQPADEVTAMQYALQPVACDDGVVLGPPRVEVRPLEAEPVAGDVEALGDAPLDEASQHRVSTLFEVLAAGCYDLEVVPLSPGGAPSEACAPAYKRHVTLLEGETTEVFLLSQCRRDDLSALRILVALNHPPEIEDLSTPADADFACGVPTELCAVASDADSDPVQLELTGPASCTIAAREPEGARRCFAIRCRAGAAALTLRAYDLVWRDGAPVRIEDWFAAEGEATTSHTQAAFELQFTGTPAWPDLDGDGHGDASVDAELTCEGDDLAGLVSNGDDCDDADARIRPGAPEICGDGLDNDCDGTRSEDCERCATPFVCNAAGGNRDEARCLDCSSRGRSAYCFSVAEGGTLCTDNFWCADASGCTTSLDCGLSEVCLVDTCCGAGSVGVCAPAKLQCSLDDVAGTSETTLLDTATGRW